MGACSYPREPLYLVLLRWARGDRYYEYLVVLLSRFVRFEARCLQIEADANFSSERVDCVALHFRKCTPGTLHHIASTSR